VQEDHQRDLADQIRGPVQPVAAIQPVDGELMHRAAVGRRRSERTAGEHRQQSGENPAEPSHTGQSIAGI